MLTSASCNYTLRSGTHPSSLLGQNMEVVSFTLQYSFESKKNNWTKEIICNSLVVEPQWTAVCDHLERCCVALWQILTKEFSCCPWQTSPKVRIQMWSFLPQQQWLRQKHSLDTQWDILFVYFIKKTNIARQFFKCSLQRDWDQWRLH